MHIPKVGFHESGMESTAKQFSPTKIHPGSYLKLLEDIERDLPKLLENENSGKH